ncbi:MAG: TPM domain-containing protein [Lachnospiraceae bacterium]|nr:TPM domain-containing protein [Lachnospiraceae bacterium]
MLKSRKIFSFVLILVLTCSVLFTVIKLTPAKADDLFDDIWDSVFDDDDDYYYSDDDSLEDDTSTASSDVPVSSEINTGTGITKQNSVTGFAAMVYDLAGLMSQTEAKTLLEDIYQYTEFGDMVVLTTNENTYGNSESATDKYCEAFYQKYSKKSDCVIFCIDMKTRYILVYSAGSVVENNLTRSKCDSITDNVYSYASDKQYFQCASKAYEQIGKVLNGMHIAQPMKVVSNLFIAFVVGFVIMYLVALSKSKVGKTGDDELLKYVAVNFAANNPTDIVTGTTKTYCPRSSGSSGGGRSGGGGGGHSHSSGGHRF